MNFVERGQVHAPADTQQCGTVSIGADRCRPSSSTSCFSIETKKKKKENNAMLRCNERCFCLMLLSLVHGLSPRPCSPFFLFSFLFFVWFLSKMCEMVKWPSAGSSDWYLIITVIFFFLFSQLQFCEKTSVPNRKTHGWQPAKRRCWNAGHPKAIRNRLWYGKR